MAIGSAPEIGVTFARWGDMTPEQRTAWFAQMKGWGKDLVAGYGTIAYPAPDRIKHHHSNWRTLT